MPDDGAQGNDKDDEFRLAMAIAASGTGIWDRDLQNGEIHYSSAWKAMLGYHDSEIGNRIEDSYARVHPADLAMVQQTIRRHVEGHTPMYEVEHRLRCKDGRYIWVISRGRVSGRDAAGTPLRMTGATIDISATMALSDQLRQSVELLTNLTDEVPGLVYQYRQASDGSSWFPYVSAGIADLFGLAPAEVAASGAPVMAAIHPEDRELYQLSLATSAASLKRWHLEFRVPAADGATRWCQGDAQPRRLADGGTLWHGFISDITERKAIEQQLQDAAATDFLTGLPNRRDLMMCMEQELARIRRDPMAISTVLMFDLDHFKMINDHYGHATGDEVLKHFARMLRQQLRKIDAVGRIGGEEFAVVLSGAAAADAVRFAERVRTRMAGTPLVEGERAIAVTVSIGVAAMRAGDASVTNALSRADAALYRAKQAGRDRVQCAAD
ncbi:MAG: diguanylate cyclase [Pseudomonadota bacterium]